ncbi:MAG: hypothetical protein HC869_06710 [Rhodospirillales bacterium]|nr:hypothetical protein [Rhodospirillales bacterium]
MHDLTREQLETLSIRPGSPLLICDVDEVVVHFTRDFETYLGARELELDTMSLALSGNVKHRASGVPIPDPDLQTLVTEFFMDRTLHMEPIDGAIESLQSLAEDCQIVMLTNLPHEAGALRRRNLEGHGCPTLSSPTADQKAPRSPPYPKWPMRPSSSSTTAQPLSRLPISTRRMCI